MLRKDSILRIGEPLYVRPITVRLNIKLVAIRYPPIRDTEEKTCVS